MNFNVQVRKKKPPIIIKKLPELWSFSQSTEVKTQMLNAETGKHCSSVCRVGLQVYLSLNLPLLCLNRRLF